MSEAWQMTKHICSFSASHWSYGLHCLQQVDPILVSFVAVNNYKLGGLKQYSFIVLQLWRSEITGLKSRCQKGCFIWRLLGRLLLLALPALEATGMHRGLWLKASSSIFKASSAASSTFTLPSSFSSLISPGRLPYIMIVVITFKSHPDNSELSLYLKILNSNHICKASFTI
jgi:hypothetical protein